MNYLIYNERGEIEQSTKVYDHDGYDELLHDRGMKFVKVESSAPLHMNDFWVSNNYLTARPEMPFSMNKLSFKADGVDATLIKGLPKPCRVTVIVTGNIKLVDNEEITEGEVEISSPIAATYEVLVDAWPYKPRRFVVEAQ